MISSQEFHQKLQAGRIHEALTLVMQSAIELDITTRITEDLEQDRSGCHEYLRTKIDLLTGNIENEVSQNAVSDSPKYLKLQQLHLDRINNTHQIVRDYLHQIRAILTVLPPSAFESKSILSATERAPVSPEPKILTIEPDNDDLDLSIERDGEVWEEWVEDEDFISSAEIPVPPILSRLPHPQPPSQWIGRSIDSIALKPIVPRAIAAPIDLATQWEKFEPEYMGPDLNHQPHIQHYPDPQQMDKILADLDI